MNELEATRELNAILVKLFDSAGPEFGAALSQEVSVVGKDDFFAVSCGKPNMASSSRAKASYESASAR